MKKIDLDELFPKHRWELFYQNTEFKYAQYIY